MSRLRRLHRAGLIVLAAFIVLGATEIPARAADPVTVSGTITDFTTGTPIDGACVALSRNSAVVATSCADATGHYAVVVAAGGYIVEASAAGYSNMWIDGNYLYAASRWFDNSGTADFSMVHALPSASGLVTDPNGNPVQNAEVWFRAVNGTFSAFRYTDTAGGYSIATVPPIPIKVSVKSSSPSYPTQYVPGKMTSADGTAFTPGDGEAITVDEQFLPYGEITATVTDKVTGSPISGVCINTYFTTKCADNSGKITASIPFGTWPVGFTVPTAYLPTPAPVSVTVLPGEVTPLQRVLPRRTSILVTSHEAGSPSWQPPTCVIAVPLRPGVFNSPSQTAYGPSCGTYNSGPIEVWLDEALPVQLFAYSGSTTDGNGPPQFGAQWVGATRGTGDRQLAKVIDPVPNVRNDGPMIVLDPPRVISGSVGDTMTGQICISAVALPLTVPGNPSYMQVETCSFAVPEGAPRFSINGLGPYRWPLYFTSKDGRGNVWSGGATNRLSATLVDASTPIHQDMPGQGGSIQGTITGGSGGQVLAYDASTGDYLGKAAVNGTAFTIGGLNTRPVVLQYRPVSGQACWPVMPTTVLRRAAGSISVTLGKVTPASIAVGSGCALSAQLTALPAPRRTTRPPLTGVPRRR